MNRGTRSDRVGRLFTWMCGGALALNLVLAVGLIALIGRHGAAYFWQSPIALVELEEGGALFGEIHGWEDVPKADAAWAGERRLRLKIGNRDLYGLDFRWLRESEVEGISYPDELVVLERLEWGNFYGRLVQLRDGSRVVVEGESEAWRALPALHDEKVVLLREIDELESGPLSDVNYEIEKLNLARRRLELRVERGESLAGEIEAVETETAAAQKRYGLLAKQLFELRDRLAEGKLLMPGGNGQAGSGVGWVLYPPLSTTEAGMSMDLAIFAVTCQAQVRSWARST